MRALAVAILTACLVYAGCSSERVSGNTSSETTNGVAAVVQYPDGAPATGAVVRVRHVDYLSAVPSLSKSAGIIGADALTDLNGRFVVGDLEPGDYRIEVTDGQLAVLLSCSLGAQDTAELGIDTLLPFAVVRGTVDLSESPATARYVQVRGMERLVAVDSQGRFTIADLPAAVLSLRVVAADSLVAPVTIDSVRTAPGTAVELPLAGWRYSKRLVLNTTSTGANVTGDVTGFPLLVRLDSSVLDFGQADDAGQDLRFTTSAGLILPCEVEKWDRLNAQAAIWVRLDTVRGNDSSQYVTMHWGATGASVSDGPAVFDTADGFAGVWHLGEETPGASGASIYADASPNGFDGADYVSATEQIGIVGNGHRLDRSAGDYIDLGRDRNYISGASQVTLEAWCNVDDNESAGMVLTHSLDNPANPYLSYAYIMVHGSVIVGARLSPADTVDQTIMTAQQLVPRTWNHIVAVIKFDADSGYVYVNGALWHAGIVAFDGTATAGSVSTQSVAGSQEQPHQAFFGGTLDELRTQRTARSAAWVKLCYESQRSQQTVLTWR